MSFLRRIFGEKPPAWAGLNAKEYKIFIGQVHDALQQLGLRYTDRLEEGGIHQDNGMMGLTSLCRIWKKTDVDKREAEVHRFVSLAHNPQKTEDDLTWEDAKDRLRMRIYPVNSMPEVIQAIVHQSLCEALDAVVMLDSEFTACSLRREMAAQWLVDEAEILRVATENVVRYEQVQVDRVPIDNEISFTVIYGDSIYTASHALSLDRFIMPACANGAMVMVPDRRTAIFTRAETDSMTALNAMIRLTTKLYEEADGAISPCLFWWREGTWQIAGYPNAKGYDVVPPAELVELFG